MIVKYLHNPLEPKIESIEVDYTYMTMEEYFKECFPQKSDEYVIPIATGKIVDWDYIPSKNDDIIFTVDLSGGKFLGAILGAALIAASFIPAFAPVSAFLLSSGISMIAGSIVPSTDTFEDSPTYHWDGIQSWTKEGGPVPILYGEHRVGGCVVEAFVEKISSKTEYLYMLLAISEGPIEEIDVSTIEINKKNISHYSDVTTYTKLGSDSQTAIPEFAKIARFYSINNIQLTYNTPYVYETFNDVDKCKITLKFPALYSMTKKGNFEDKTCTFKVEYKLTTDTTYTTYSTQTVTAKTKSIHTHTFDISFPVNGKYDIRITRQTAEFTGVRESGDSYLDSVTEYEHGKIAYKNTALLGLKIKATDQLSGNLPNVTVVAKGRILYDVKDDTNVYSNNPANVIYDLLTHERYGLGQYLDSSTNINLESLKDYHDNCDEIVSYEEYNTGTGSYDTKSEKRYEINLYTVFV